MSRPTFDTWIMNMATLTASRSTCLRRHVGCILVNARGHVIATGYNGVAAGLRHCNEVVMIEDDDTNSYACAGAQSPSGTDLDNCEAIHAEQNALLQCADVHTIKTCYSTTAPCITCVKLLLNTSCQEIVFAQPYPHSLAEDLWTRAGHIWRHYQDNESMVEQ